MLLPTLAKNGELVFKNIYHKEIKSEAELKRANRLANPYMIENI